MGEARGVVYCGQDRRAAQEQSGVLMLANEVARAGYDDRRTARGSSTHGDSSRMFFPTTHLMLRAFRDVISTFRQQVHLPN